MPRTPDRCTPAPLLAAPQVPPPPRASRPASRPTAPGPVARRCSPAVQVLRHQRAGVPLSDMALLYRTNFTHKPFAEALAAAGLPYRVVRGGASGRARCCCCGAVGPGRADRRALVQFHKAAAAAEPLKLLHERAACQRTRHTSQLPAFLAGLPQVGSKELWDRMEVRDVLAYLRLVVNPGGAWASAGRGACSSIGSIVRLAGARAPRWRPPSPLAPQHAGGRAKSSRVRRRC